MKVEIEDGKYTYQLHPDGRSEVLRHGEPWRDTVGDKFIYCMASEIDELRQRVAEFIERSNLKDETIDRLQDELIALQGGDEITTLRQRVQELEERRCEICGYAEHHREHTGCLRVKVKELTAERDALKQQRDELLAALGSGGRHCNDDTPHSNLCEAIIDSKEADLGQGLDPFWKWAFRRGFHEAETSYKVDIATLEQQRDELLAELEELSLYVAYNGDDWVQKKARAAIATVKEK